jgi:hypothetical protein
LTFAKEASLKDPAKLFNSSLDGNARRAIDIHEGEEVDAGARLRRSSVPRSPSIHPAERQGQDERSRLRDSAPEEVRHRGPRCRSARECPG